MARRITLSEHFLDEAIIYGGLPVTRATAYALALEATGNKVAADRFAFGPRIRVVPGTKVMTLLAARTLIAA